MKVAIVGGTGAFGRALAKRLHEIGKDEVLVGSRDSWTVSGAGLTAGPAVAAPFSAPVGSCHDQW